MEDKLIFPIGFDLERGVKEAEKNMEVFLRRLEQTAARKPVTIKAELDTKQFAHFENALHGSIEHISEAAQRLRTDLQAALQTDGSTNIDRLTQAMRELESAWKALPLNQKFDIEGNVTQKAREMVEQYNQLSVASETAGKTLARISREIKQASESEIKAAQRSADAQDKALQKKIAASQKLVNTLKSTENSIVNVTAKLQYWNKVMNSVDVGSKKWEYAVSQVNRLTERLNALKTKTSEATIAIQNAASKQVAAHTQVSSALHAQTTYIERLIRRMAVYASFSMAGNILTNIREVTAQFELQRVSLAAIIQDQAKADQLFSQIKSFALESPLKILDLTKYTKQLAAYKIETDDLFDTMKRLADVSVGLGVSMDRLILAYGQIKATGYLRASEVRQLTEAGIPIVDELAKKLSAANGELVRASDVMDMISKREIPFEMVADIFQDMTDKGGMFYDMQVKQGDTLYGMWQKLGDAAAVMYDEIGKSDAVNSVMKGTIDVLRTLMKNWKTTATVLGIASLAAIKVAFSIKSVALATANASAANVAYRASLLRNIVTLRAEQAALGLSNLARKVQIWGLTTSSKLNLLAASSTNVLTRSLYKLTAAMLSNPWTMVITAVSMIISYFVMAASKANELADSLSEIDTKYAEANREAASNITTLAERAVKAADGTKKQKDALDELSRTYGNIIPQELLTIENLRAMQGEYQGLIDLVEEYNIKQKYQERKTAIQDTYSQQVKTAEKNARDWLNARGVSNTDMRQTEIVQQIKDAVAEGKSAQEATAEVLNRFKDDISRGDQALNLVNLLHPEKLADAWEATFNPNEIQELAIAIEGMTKAIEENDAAMENEINGLNRYAESVNKAEDLFNKNSDNLYVKHLMIKFDLDNEDSLGEWIRKLEEGEVDSFYANGGKSDEIKEELEKNRENFEEWSKQEEEILESIEYYKNRRNELGASFPIVEEQKLHNLEKELEFINGGYLDKKAELEQALDDLLITREKMAEFSGMSGAEELDFITQQTLNSLKEIIEGTSGMLDFSEAFSEAEGQVIINFEKLRQIVIDNGNDQQLLAAISTYQQLYERLVPSDELTMAAHLKIRSIGEAAGASGKIMTKLFKSSSENWETYHKRVKEVAENTVADIAALRGEIALLEEQSANLSLFDQFVLKAKRAALEQAEKDKVAAEQAEKWARTFLPQENKSNKSKSKKEQDTRLQSLQEMVKLVQTLYKEYQSWEKKIGSSQAAEKVYEVYEKTIKMAEEFASKNGFKLPELEVPTNASELNSFLAEIQKLMDNEKLKGGKKAAVELGVTMDKSISDEWQKDIEKKIKELADNVSKSKTAKEFYDKVLNLTGDVQLATTVSMNVYGSDGKSLEEDFKNQIEEAFSHVADMPSPIKAEMESAISRADYTSLTKYLEYLPEEYKKTAEKLIQTQQQLSSKQYEQWLKDIDKAKEYADKRIELSRYTANNIEDIEKRIATLDPTQKDYADKVAVLKAIIKGYQDRETREAAQLEYEAFKETPLYVQMFDNLEQASTGSLERMKAKLIDLQGVWESSLDPTQLKEMQSRMNEIEEQLRTRNPWKSLKEAYENYKSTATNYMVSGAEARLATAQAVYNKVVKDSGSVDSYEARAAKRTLDIETQRLKIATQLTDENGKLLKGRKAMEKAADIASDNVAKANVELAQALAREQAATTDTEKKAAAEVVAQKKEAYNIAVATSDAIQSDLTTTQKLKKALLSAGDNATQWLNAGAELARGIASIAETFGASEEDVQYFNDIADGISNISSGLTDIIQNGMSGNLAGVLTSIFTAVPKFVSGFSSIFNAGRIRRANKAIKEQEEILEHLETTYERLETVASKLFGTDYISNYNQQMRVLQAQQTAYLKQAEAERSKGKKADEDKIKGYEDKAQETADKIKEMQSELTSHFVGSDRQSLAKEFAQSWLDAKVSFASTTDAIKSKYKEMIKSMVVEGAAAKLIDSILAPMWNKMDSMLEANDIEGATDYIVKGMDKFVTQADGAMNTLYQKLQAKGYDMQKLLGDSESGSNLTGIARDIATASEESINGLATGINTQNYYMSHMPAIAADVAALRALMISGDKIMYNTPDTTSMVDLVALQNQSLSHLASIDNNMALAASRAEKAAEAAEQIAIKLSRAIISKGQDSTYGIKVFM